MATRAVCNACNADEQPDWIDIAGPCRSSLYAIRVAAQSPLLPNTTSDNGTLPGGWVIRLFSR
ncbi:hypothetical protein BamMEX5DRAFT_5972 [Burkholderia ambifaria MEX-5]|uniref:Uncharacterized protein n=1 Tax=Burkholderia ambifaria MEX-5 TaxID=396597 RepID=B1TDV6_9BURK|nr:hypothetical protein BamMEX5DRAFT_5972 [Burkholderia ambifaria MEX-5]